MTKHSRHIFPFIASEVFYQRSNGAGKKRGGGAHEKNGKKRKIVQETDTKFHISQTLTKTKKEMGGKMDETHDGIATAHHRIKVGEKKKSVDYSVGKLNFMDTTSGSVFNSAGLVQWSEITHIGSTSQWLVATSSASSLFGLAASTVPYFLMNPSQANTGSALLAAVVQPATDKLCLQKCKLRVDIANFNTVPTFCSFYVLISKINHNYLPSTLFNAVLNKNEGQLISTSLTTPAAGLGVGGQSGKFNSNVLFDNGPNYFPEFNKFFKVLKVHRTVLAAAAQESIIFDFELNQVGDASRMLNMNNLMDSGNPTTWTNANITNGFPKGHICVFMCQRGGVVDDATIGSVPTYGGSKTGIIATKTYEFRAIKSNTNRVNVTDGFDQLPILAANAAQRIIDNVDNISNVKIA